MTPKEKAVELVNQFLPLQIGRKPKLKLAKQCAIMCCDELISEHTFKYPIKWNLRQVRYWQQVKIEIEKL